MWMEEEFQNFVSRVLDAVDDACKTEVAQAVGDAVSQSVHRNVYDAYETDSYRRMDNGGLSDTENLTAETQKSTDSVTLIMHNETPFQGESNQDGLTLSQVVQEGRETFHMPFPRPYMEDAEKEIAGTDVVSALWKGLARNGVI